MSPSGHHSRRGFNGGRHRVIWTLSAASRCGVYMSMLLRHWSITSPRPWGQAGGSFCWEAVRHEAPLVARSMRPPKPRWSLSPELGGRAGACRGDGQRRGSRGNRYADASSAGQRSSPPRLPPLGRLITPQEVVSLVSWLLSEGASAMTGQELVMCGGASLG